MNPEVENPARTRRKNRYVPHLARFYFSPSYDWSVQDASHLYSSRRALSDQFELDRVYFEDCISGMARLPSELVDLVIADPPFGIDFDGKSGAYNRVTDYVVEGYREVTESYDRFTSEWIGQLPRVMQPHASAYVFSGWNNLEAVLRSARENGLTTINHIVWKYQFGVYTRQRFVTSHYHILLLVKDPDKYFFNKHQHYPQDVWRIKRHYRMAQTKNSTRLPLELVSRCIDFSSRPGDLVLDPFMGNATTAVAAKSNWRHFIGFEINPQMKTIVENELSRVVPGQMYTPYASRLPTIEELAVRYPAAYREYLRAGETHRDTGTTVDK
jgi:site-specific DNA-methyltransferase (adenine-specific)